MWKWPGGGVPRWSQRRFDGSSLRARDEVSGVMGNIGADVLFVIGNPIPAFELLIVPVRGKYPVVLPTEGYTQSFTGATGTLPRKGLSRSTASSNAIVFVRGNFSSAGGGASRWCVGSEERRVSECAWRSMLGSLLSSLGLSTIVSAGSSVGCWMIPITGGGGGGASRNSYSSRGPSSGEWYHPIGLTSPTPPPSTRWIISVRSLVPFHPFPFFLPILLPDVGRSGIGGRRGKSDCWSRCAFSKLSGVDWCESSDRGRGSSRECRGVFSAVGGAE